MSTKIFSLYGKTVKELIDVYKQHDFKHSKYKCKKDLINGLIKHFVFNEYRKLKVLGQLSDIDEEQNTRITIDTDDELTHLIARIKQNHPKDNISFTSHSCVYKDDEYDTFVRRYSQEKGTLGSMGEKLLFHGTSIDNLDSILENDLLLNANHSNGTVFGKGVYFTNNLQKAMRYSTSSKKCIMICKVHIGEITHGERNMVVPPKGYDTTVNNIDNPDIFVKYKSRTFKIVGYLEIDLCKESVIQINKRGVISNSKFTVGNIVDYKNEMYKIIGRSPKGFILTSETTGRTIRNIPSTQICGIPPNKLTKKVENKPKYISVSFKNTIDEAIGIYYVPEHLDPLKLAYGGIGDPTSGPLSQCKNMGFIDPSKNLTFNSIIGHKFICTTKDYIIQIIEIKQGGEIIV